MELWKGSCDQIAEALPATRIECSGGGLHGFVFDGATFTAIDVPSATRFTQASGINDNGPIVGFFGDDVGVLGEHGFVETPAESDRTSPVITVSASPATLSPPNGRLVTVTVMGAIAEEPKAPGCMLARIRPSRGNGR